MIYKTRSDAFEAMKRKEIIGFSELDGVFIGINAPTVEKPASVVEILSGSDPKDEEIDFYGGSDDE